jgi:hypothetical protein
MRIFCIGNFLMNKNIYNLPPCAFCHNEIEGAYYVWIINQDMSKNICCLNCKNKKSVNPIGYRHDNDPPKDQETPQSS